VTSYSECLFCADEYCRSISCQSKSISSNNGVCSSICQLGHHLRFSTSIEKREVFALTPPDAGARTAIFVLVATLSRPVGGWLSDRIGGQKLLLYIFLGIALISWLMATNSIWLFTFGSLGCAILFGLGNGGVFKLVPQYFPQQTGSVTGLVGAAGGLGGFFPPIVLGICRDMTGSYTIGFCLLIVFALTCTGILSQTFLKLTAKLS
jgi:MFS transporter, NNP family, nitrate/nitrite transporter